MPVSANDRKWLVFQIKAPRGQRCEACQAAKKGHCGTERATKGCLRQAENARAQLLKPVNASSGSDVEIGEAGGVSVPGAQERTLGIQAQLHALSQRKLESHAAKSQAVPKKSKAGGKGSVSGNRASASEKKPAVQKSASGKPQSNGKPSTAGWHLVSLCVQAKILKELE